jgi:hypothetical protein
VVEEVDACVARRANELAHIVVVGLLGDGHQAEHDVWRDDLGSGQGEGLHTGDAPVDRDGHAARQSPARVASSSSARVRSTERTESVMLAGRDAPRMGMTTGSPSPPADIDVGLSQPVLQTRLADSEVGRHLLDRHAVLLTSRDGHNVLTELPLDRARAQ